MSTHTYDHVYLMPRFESKDRAYVDDYVGNIANIGDSEGIEFTREAIRTLEGMIAHCKDIKDNVEGPEERVNDVRPALEKYITELTDRVNESKLLLQAFTEHANI